MPPLCMLALGKSGEGAYSNTREPCDDHYQCTFSGYLMGKTRENQQSIIKGIATMAQIAS